MRGDFDRCDQVSTSIGSDRSQRFLRTRQNHGLQARTQQERKRTRRVSQGVGSVQNDNSVVSLPTRFHRSRNLEPLRGPQVGTVEIKRDFYGAIRQLAELWNATHELRAQLFRFKFRNPKLRVHSKGAAGVENQNAF